MAAAVSEKHPRPILKWVGGKTQILDRLLSEFPTEEMNNYREIFLGGGSVLFAFLAQLHSGRFRVRGHIYAYDINEPLIYVYKNIQLHADELFRELQVLIEQRNACETPAEGCPPANRSPTTLDEATTSVESFYYWIRAQYNALSQLQKQSVAGSAMFVFLNKMCFRGVFRVGPKGFNVPYGHYAHPEIVNWEHLAAIRALIQPVVFACCDFTESMAAIQPGDFVYLDPPYAPETSKSFVGYTEQGFSAENHAQLFDLIHRHGTHTRIMMSNADVDLVRAAFREPPFTVDSLVCKRAIHSKAPDSKTREVIVKNYDSGGGNLGGSQALHSLP